MPEDVKADRKTFTEAVRRLLATPPLPKNKITRKQKPKPKATKTQR